MHLSPLSTAPSAVRLALFAGVFAMAAPAFAQHANIWYFGMKAGIDFNSGAPVALSDGEMITFEGCASFCNDAGELLFYTNGGPVITAPLYNFGAVWNRNNVVMPNGSLVSGGGCNSATQGSLIVPDPGNSEHFYVFTTDCHEHVFAGGLRYSEVDMALGGGLGDVTTIGTPLLADVSESMAGIRHANGVDVWVLVHGLDNSEYHAFLVTASGITGPVTTTIGPQLGEYSGQLATNLTGTKVFFGASTTANLLDFDPATGVLSNHVNLGHNNILGGAFAPGGRYLYISEHTTSRRTFQYDLLADDVQASEVIIGTGIGTQPSLQLGPDGKIYMAKNGMQYLGVINNPDLPGTAAGFQEEGVQLGADCRAALPNFVNDLIIPGNTGIHARHNTVTVNYAMTTDALTIQLGADMGQGRFSIFRSDGRLMQEGRLAGSTTVVPITAYASGPYIVRVAGNDGRIGAASFVVAR